MADSAVATTAVTPAQRITAALDRTRDAFPEASNAKLLQAILAEVAADSVAQSPTFAAEVRSRYAAEIEAVQVAKAAKQPRVRQVRPKVTPKVSEILEPLTPIKHIPNLEITLAGPLDPYLLLEIYGSDQLARALKSHSPADLRRAVALVQERNPGTQPTSKTSTASLISYIVKQLTDVSVAGVSTRN